MRKVWLSFSRLITLVIAFAFLGMIVACGGVGPTSSVLSKPVKPNDKSYSTELEAELIAEQFIKDYLVNPLDAKFGRRADGSYVGDGDWRVTGTVTARNGFGADLTRKFNCIVRHEGRKRFTLRYLQIGREVLFDRMAADARDNVDRIIASMTTPASVPAEEENKVSAQVAVERQRRYAEARERQGTEVSRKWSDDTGRFSVNATFAGYGMGKVKLRKADGTTVDVDRRRLSEDDQEYLREKWRKRGKQPPF